MPRARQTFDQATRTTGARDRDLDRAAGEDDDGEDGREWTSAALSALLREKWRTIPPAARQVALRAEIGAKFRKRFGFAWDHARNALFMDPNWPPKRQPGQKSRGLAQRARLVKMLDFENHLCLPPRSDGSHRFLSVLELTWVSLLAGNWPPAARRKGPDAVLVGERILIKEALDRHGQKPFEGWDGEKVVASKILRGPRNRLGTRR